MSANEKTTVQFEPPPDWAIELSSKVANGFKQVNDRLSTVEANVTVLVADKQSTNERLSRIETWRENEVNARLNATSERVRGESKTNADQDAAIAAILIKQDEMATALAKQSAGLTDQLSKLSDVLAPVVKSPAARKLGSAVVAVLLVAVAVLGARLEMQLAELKAKPAAVQPAPTVYLPAPATALDGGSP